MLKAELEKNVDNLIGIKNKLLADDENIRMQFARIFSWREIESRYDREGRLRTPSWFEIFAEVGKLLKIKETVDLEKKLDEAGDTIMMLQDELNMLHEKEQSQRK